MSATELKILEIQNKIFNLVHPKNDVSVHFRYNVKTGLDLITFNGKNNEMFLLKKLKPIDGDITDELTLHEIMLDYVKELVSCIEDKTTSDKVGYSFTVEWRKEGGKTQISYFHGVDINEILTKFYYGKEGIKHLFTIFGIKMNPLS